MPLEKTLQLMQAFSEIDAGLTLLVTKGGWLIIIQ